MYVMPHRSSGLSEPFHYEDAPTKDVRRNYVISSSVPLVPGSCPNAVGYEADGQPRLRF